MADKNFTVKHGLTVGPLTIDAATGNITTTGTVTGASSVAAGVFYENSQTVTTNYTITTNKNAMSAGPITIATGITVTVPTGSVWTIV